MEHYGEYAEYVKYMQDTCHENCNFSQASGNLCYVGQTGERPLPDSIDLSVSPCYDYYPQDHHLTRGEIESSFRLCLYGG